MDYIKTENLKNYLEQAYKKLKNNTIFDISPERCMVEPFLDIMSQLLSQ